MCSAKFHFLSVFTKLENFLFIYIIISLRSIPGWILGVELSFTHHERIWASEELPSLLINPPLSEFEWSSFTPRPYYHRGKKRPTQ